MFVMIFYCSLKASATCKPKTNNSEWPQTNEWKQKLVNTVHSSVTIEEREQLKRILESYQDCFSR